MVFSEKPDDSITFHKNHMMVGQKFWLDYQKKIINKPSYGFDRIFSSEIITFYGLNKVALTHKHKIDIFNFPETCFMLFHKQICILKTHTINV